MYDAIPVTFSELQAANVERAALWSRKGEGGRLEFATIELGGETGELLNKIKKYLRFKAGMVGGEDNLEDVADELGDVVICCSLLAIQLNLDLGAVTVRKFNKTSDKHGFPVKLPA